MSEAHVTRENLSDVIAEQLKTAILKGELTPGTRLKQQELAKAFTTSLIPVREALRTLEREGLVTLSANRGAEVRAISADEVRQIFEIRKIIETGALELAMSKHDEACFSLAAEILDEMDIMSDVAKLSDLNKEFHECLYGACGNLRLLELIDTNFQNIDRYMRLYLVDTENNVYSQVIHREILEAVQKQDFDAAKALMATHMETAMTALIEQINLKGGIQS
ncbi:MAG: hypothetical protein PWP51_2086 [Clostridiales bacterium]|jgi:DNA-binding GntR family transcriptional regulator|nr:hypothetical protein [Clostridiales bacterium]MDN5299533.1 hypothetical protein [Clostridiales bacterium]